LIRQHRRDLVNIIRRRCDNDDVDGATSRKGANGMDQHRDAAEKAKCLGGTGSEAFAPAGSGNQDCGPRFRHRAA
jgi:hypothetical protein